MPNHLHALIALKILINP